MTELPSNPHFLLPLQLGIRISADEFWGLGHKHLFYDMVFVVWRWVKIDRT